MKTIVIYIDILLGLNLYLSWLLILAAEKLSGLPVTPWRKALAATVGSLSSLLILLPPLPDFLLACSKLLLGAVISGIAFGTTSRRFFRGVIWFYGANFLFLGVITLLWTLFQPPRLALRNGSVYYHISSLTLIIATIAAYGVVRAIALISSKKMPQNTLRKATLTVNGSSVSLIVFYDSGNCLHSLSGLPVLVCKKAALQSLLPLPLLSNDAAPFSQLPEEWKKRVELIPCSSIGGETLLPAFRPDVFAFENTSPRPCIVALSSQNFLSGEADAIGGGDLFSNL